METKGGFHQQSSTSISAVSKMLMYRRYKEAVIQ